MAGGVLAAAVSMIKVCMSEYTGCLLHWLLVGNLPLESWMST